MIVDNLILRLIKLSKFYLRSRLTLSMDRFLKRWAAKSTLPNPDDTSHGLEAWEVRAANEAIIVAENTLTTSQSADPSSN